MYEWEVRMSEVKKDEKTISCSVYTVTVFADDEEEVRAIVAEEVPELTIDRIARVESND